MMGEQDFRNHAEAALNVLKQHLFKREDESGAFETEEQGGVLQVIFEEPPTKFVLTANAPVQQIWISARTTSFKLDWSGPESGFVLPKTGEALLPLVDRLIDEQLND
jgi:CyaY protein